MPKAPVGRESGARSAAVRGQYMQMFAAHVDRLPGADRDAIRTSVPESVLRDIDAAGRFSWLPIEVNLLCTRAVAQKLGEERAHVFFRTLLLDAMQSPLLRALVDSVLRITVRDPGLYLTWVGKGFELMFRDLGRWDVVERDLGRAVLRLSDLAAECITDDVWIQSLASAMCAFEELVKVTGSVTVHGVDVPERRVLFLAQWH